MAPTGDVLFWTFMILGFLITLASFQLLVSAMLPRVVARSRDSLRRRPVVSGLVGVIVFLLTVGLMKGLSAAGQFGTVIGLGIVVTSVTLGVCGLAGFSRIVGERLPSSIDHGSPWRPTLRGAIVTELAFVTPVVGWILFALALAAAGGSGVLGGTGLHRLLSAIRHGRRTPPAPLPMDPVAPDAVEPVVEPVEEPVA